MLSVVVMFSRLDCEVHLLGSEETTGPAEVVSIALVNPRV